LKQECYASSLTWTTGLLLQTPTLRSGGLKLSYLNTAIAAYYINN
jgi:hypothetical protein